MSGLTASSNVTTIAKQLIAQCNLIQPSRLPELEQLLMYLQKRKLEKKGEAGYVDVRLVFFYRHSKCYWWVREQPAITQRCMCDEPKHYIHNYKNKFTQDEERANMAELDSYLELLYDDLQAKIRGTGLILQLARNPDNLNELSSNGVCIIICRLDCRSK